MSHKYFVGNAFQDVVTANIDWTDGNISAYGAGAIRDGYADRRGDSGGEVTTPITLTIDFGTATALEGIALINHNFAEWDAPEFAVDTSSDGMSYTTLMSGAGFALSRRGLVVRDTYFGWSSLSKRYWKFTFDESITPASRIIRLGELVGVSSLTSLARHAIYGEGESMEYFRSESTMSNGDIKTSLLGGPIATRNFSFADLNDSQRTELLTMWHATQGGSKALLWLPDHTTGGTAPADQECIFGRITPTMGWTQPDFGLYDMDGFTLRACGRHVGA